MPTSLPSSLLALEPVERDALVVLAVSPSPLSLTGWQDKLRGLDLRVGTRGVYGDTLKTIATKLVATGAVLRRGPDQSLLLVAAEVAAAALEDARDRGRLEALLRAQDGMPAWRWAPQEEALRVAVALGDAEKVSAAVARMAWRETGRGEVPPVVLALTPWAPARWIAQLPPETGADFVRDVLDLCVIHALAVGPDVLRFAESSVAPELRARAAIRRALLGDASGARALLGPGGPSPWEVGAAGVIELAEGRWAEAAAAFESAAKTKTGGRRARALPSYLAVLQLLLEGAPIARAAEATALVARVKATRSTLEEWPSARDALTALASYRATGRIEPWSGPSPTSTWLDHLADGLATRWTGDTRRPFSRPALGAYADAVDAAGYTWVARQLRALLEESPSAEALASLTSSSASWELALDALAGAFDAPIKGTASKATGELVWTLDDFSAELDTLRLTPRLVKKAGQAGASVSIDRLETDASLPLTDEDRPLVAALVAAKRAHHGGLLPARTLLHAVGHPRVRDDDGAPLSIERGVPEVHVVRAAVGVRLEAFPTEYGRSGLAAQRKPGRVVLFERTEAVARVATVLGDRGLDVPAEGLARAASTLTAIAPHVAVRGIEALGKTVGARAEAADGRIRVQIARAGQTFRARLRVVPGGHEGPALRPGSEPAHVLFAGAAGTRALTRDLAAERASAERLLDACPVLASLPLDGDDRVAGDVEACLDLLLELEARRQDGVLVEWPEGEALRPPITPGSGALRVRVEGKAQWLQVDAELQIDERRVVGFADLVERASAARGRFVPLGDGQYLALTEKLREQVEALSRVAALSDKKGRASLALLPALAQWVDGEALDLTSGLRDRLDALERALGSTPRPPRALQAELRDYQRDCFVFLARRAASGLGSCLADDMGLGKTVQALALLVARAKDGPALVVAPTSVCRNWEDEGRRFAPTLTFHGLAGAADRAACIKALGPADVLLVSYGLLATCAAPLAERRFATAVFDEAHALKNAETRRAAAARGVEADAVVALTGTPLENHLGELHSLFDVLAPGLLGTRERFERAFAAPIGRGDKRATSHLRALVRPFLLRRTKSQVLDELPEKTEMTRVIAPSDEERAFYEALRRRALSRVQEATASQGGKARIQVLAEITKLRRASVDPRLVGGAEAPAGSKLEALAELVSELREEGHRALVFSQFLEVLDRAGERLTADGARCVRLDGTLSAADRAAAVDAFQSGQADVFLLSLRAGGVGMNLTAADYVIHLDPWWNPAVEDQATDRAHRIGQTRPVTVVRLVTEGTIEEKVLRLHADKRALYADALGELETAKKVDIQALAALLRDDAAPPERGAARPDGAEISS